MKNNSETLREIMRDHKLRRDRIAELTGRSLNAVASWLRAPGTSGHRNMPNHALELLQSKIGNGTTQP